MQDIAYIECSIILIWGSKIVSNICMIFGS